MKKPSKCYVKGAKGINFPKAKSSILEFDSFVLKIGSLINNRKAHKFVQHLHI